MAWSPLILYCIGIFMTCFLLVQTLTENA